MPSTLSFRSGHFTVASRFALPHDGMQGADPPRAGAGAG